MKSVLRLHDLEDRLTPAVAISSAYETYAWVLVNSLRQNPAAFANNLQGLVNGTVGTAFGFTKSDPIITDLKSMIGRASMPANYGASLALMRATPNAGPLAWDETLESTAGKHVAWMETNGFAHTGTAGSRMALPGFSSNDAAAPDTWGYGYPTYTSWGEDIGWAVGSLQSTKAAYNSGSVNVAGLQQRAAFLDTVAYMLELNSSSLGHLENLLGRDSGSSATLPSFNAIGMDIALYEGPSTYETQDGLPEAWVSTHRLGLYRPNNSGGFIAGIAYQDANANGYFDSGEGAAVTVDIRDANGNGITDNLTTSNFGAFSEFLPNGTYTVTATAGGIALSSRVVTIADSNAWAELNIAGVGRPGITGPTGTQPNLRPTITWTPVDGATSYQVRIDDQVLKTTDILPNSVTTDTSWMPTSDLVSGRSYQVWVRALRGTSPGPWSSPANFSLARPSMIGPAGSVSSLRPTFSWSVVGGASQYTIRIDDLSANLTNLFPTATTTDTSWAPPSDLVSGRSYTWMVRAMNAGGFGAWTPAGSFSVARPTLTGPANGVTALRPYFTWTPVDGATAYVIVVNDVSANVPAKFMLRVPGPNWSPTSDLVSGRTYTWQVRAVNALTQGALTPLSTFTVGRAIPIGPFGPTSGPTPTFTWAGITGASSYQVRVDDLTTGQANVYLATVTDQAWTPTKAMQTGHVYRWYVRALTDGMYGAWSISKDLRVV
ncbi:MAG TPA: CAP domain-containing protein [Gemmataceae bacterium]|jgi:hypothetical protein|nr:CAP domain-containing protein [Gemmataceae bacterium]